MTRVAGVDEVDASWLRLEMQRQLVCLNSIVHLTDRCSSQHNRLNADDNVQAILVNIFGGIMRCDVIATGIINAAKEIGIRKPIVIRLQGTNVEEAKTLIEGCGFKMILADDLEDAATKAVGVADIAAQASKIQVGVKFEGFSL